VWVVLGYFLSVNLTLTTQLINYFSREKVTLVTFGDYLDITGYAKF